MGSAASSRSGKLIRLPDLDASIIPIERIVIGAAMDAGLEHIALPMLRPEEFFIEKHRVIWRAIQDQDAQGPRLGFPGLYRALKAASVADEEFGGIEYLGHCALDATDHATSRGWLGYVGQVRKAATERMVQALSISAAGGSMTVEEIRAKLDDLPAAVVSDGTIRGVWERVERGWSERRVGFGLGLDRYLGGVLPGDFIVAAARTSHGKTAFSSDRLIAWGRQDVPVAMISLEETREQVMKRLVAHVTGIALARLREGDQAPEDPLTPGEVRRARQAAEEIAALPIEVLDAGQVGLSIAQVVAACSSLAGRVVVIDHLQQIQSDRDRQSRVYAIEEILGLLKLVADKRQVALWVNAQLNREAEEAADVGLHHLRDSGAIEQKARRILLLRWLWKKTRKLEDRTAFEVTIAKNSEGGTGLITLDYDAATGRFMASNENAN